MRAIIHPDILISALPQSIPNDQPGDSLPLIDLKILDKVQERLARKIGAGHRVINGVAGSGKTVMLISRAKMLQSQNPDHQVLVLCFNVSLATYLRNCLSNCTGATVLHFDGWARQVGRSRKGRGRNTEKNEELGERLLELLQKEYPAEWHKYDAVLIDEAQDFPAHWFKCALEAMKDPLDGDLIIVADGNQGLYRPKTFTWSSVGVQARGRTISKDFNLHKNYRNSKEIVKLACNFAVESSADDREDAIFAIRPTDGVRSSGFKPVLAKCGSRLEETSRIAGIVEDLLQGKWEGQDIGRALQPSEIAVVYPRRQRNMYADFANLEMNLRKIASVVWLNDPQDRTAREKILEPGIKLQTMHSSKGLQYRAVIIIWADLLPRDFGDSDEAEDQRLMYVGMTRAEDFLAITYSGRSSFTEQLEFCAGGDKP